MNTQLGLKAETTWGTAATVDTFQEFENESIVPEVSLIEPPVMRTTTRTVRQDRWVRGVTGHAGTISLPVMTKDWGVWLDHLVGGSVTTSSIADSTYTHSADVGSLCGKGLTVQFNRPRGVCGDTDVPFTYAGGKVGQWTLSQEQGGVVMLSADMTFATMVQTTALATASYASGMEFLPWGAASLTVGGLSLPVTNWSVSCNNGLNTDRLMIRNSYARREPVENEMREITFEATCDFEALIDNTPSGAVGFPQKIWTTGGLAATVADSIEEVIITANGPTLSGTTTYPGITITMTAVRFDEANVNVAGPEMTQITVTGRALVPSGAGSTCKIAYRSTDATP
jgi:hypothetical protein